MKLTEIVFLASAALSFVGCTQTVPIVISPNLTKIDREVSSPPRIKSIVGFYIPDEAINLKVTTPMGGGVNIQYSPYKDLEIAYRLMLFNIFENVVKLKSSDDRNEISKNEIKFILSPVLTTDSGSTNSFFWPPTYFTIDVTSNIRNSTGKIVGNPRVVGSGQASQSELLPDPGLAGRRAMEDALIKMQRALLEIDYEGIPATYALPTTQSSRPNLSEHPKSQAESRLEKLKELFSKDLITKDEYEQKKREVLDNL